MTKILCKHEIPTILSHHDIILSTFTISSEVIRTKNNDLVNAPRIANNKQKVVWSAEGTLDYEEQVAPLLKRVRRRWLDPDCQASVSILLQMTNSVMNLVAKSTNKTVSLAKKPTKRSLRTPVIIKKAARRLHRAQKSLKACISKQQGISFAKAHLASTRKEYRQAMVIISEEEEKRKKKKHDRQRSQQKRQRIN